MLMIVRNWLVRIAWGVVLVVAAAGVTGAGAQTTQDDPEIDPLAAARVYRERASQLGAKGTVPSAWRAYDKRLDDAEIHGIDDAALVELELEGRRLVNRAAFLRDVKDSREPLEELLARYDRALRELATLSGLEIDPVLSGDKAAARLFAMTERTQLRRQVVLDSLRVDNRRLHELEEGQNAAQDSIITGLRIEISTLRQRLWDTELRAGVAEADRSAAESALTRRQERERAVLEIRSDLGDAGGDVLTTADGTIVVQVPGLDFAIGSANLAPGQAELMTLLADIVGRFPGLQVSVEGHTDDTGSRASNLTLSRRRALTVAGGLERRLDLPQGSIAAVGHGPDHPVAPNSTEDGRARNRRIDIVITPVGR